MTVRILKLFFVAMVGSAPVFTFAAPTWESTYTGSNYCSWGKFTNNFPQIEIGQVCTNEGEEVEIFDSGSQGYECDAYTTVQVVCCGEKSQCPKDPFQYED